jgi:biopolymer transport protein ExbB/TolQ
MLMMLENGLFALGQVLRAPVMALLWVGVFAVLFACGAALTEFVARRRERNGFDLKVWLKQGAVLDAEAKRLERLPSVLRGLIVDVQRANAESALNDGGLENLPRALVKVGPSLGLLGTLIPMGTALASLASGNLEAMAGQMVVAFTTTIIGLAIGTLAYVVTVVRQGWLNEAVREQRYLAERIALEIGAAA